MRGPDGAARTKLWREINIGEAQPHIVALMFFTTDELAPQRAKNCIGFIFMPSNGFICQAEVKQNWWKHGWLAQNIRRGPGGPGGSMVGWHKIFAKASRFRGREIIGR